MVPERAAQLAHILGDELVQLIDRLDQHYHQELAIRADIYAALVNRVQAQSGSALIRPYEALAERVDAVEQEEETLVKSLDRKRVKLADLRTIVVDLAERVRALEAAHARAVGGAGHEPPPTR